MDLGQLVRPRRRPLARLLPAGRQGARRSRPAALQRDARATPPAATSRPGSTRAPCFAPAEAPAWDDYTTWTGSVVQGDDGLWHLFYTGTSRSEDGLKQRIGHATSDRPAQLAAGRRRARARPLGRSLRGVHARPLARPGDARPLGDARPAGDGWLMFFTARVPGRGGAERRRRHRLRHLARPLCLDAAAAGLCRRRLRADGGAAGLRGERALVLPVLHRRPSTGRRPMPRPIRATPVHRHALPGRRRPARAVEGGARAVPRRRDAVPAATRRGSSRPATGWCCSASCTTPAAGRSSARSPIRRR